MSTVLVVLVVLLLLMVPVLLLLRTSANDELIADTRQAAVAVEAVTRDDLEAGLVPDAEQVEAVIGAGIGARIFDGDDNVVLEAGFIDIDMPFRYRTDGPLDTTIQITTSRSSVDTRLRDQVVQLGIVAAFGLVGAAVLAWVQARQLARPLERLARAATRLGDGDFTASAPTSSGITEIDSIARAIRLSANRVERMLESERGFTADATHQLRTGLTGLSIRLELLERHSDPDVVAEATETLSQIHDLNTTLDELLRVARKGSTGERTEIDLASLVEHHVVDWQAMYAKKRRQIVVTVGVVEPVVGTPGLVGQILNVLFENALNHGRGTVAVLVNGTSVLVEDEGSGVDEATAATIFDRPTDHQAAHGRGLALARRLAEADGGRLELTELSPATFTLSLLAAR